MPRIALGPYIKSVKVAADGRPDVDGFRLSVKESGVLESIEPGSMSDLHYPVTWFVYDAEKQESCCLRIEAQDKPLIKFTLQNLAGQDYFKPGVCPVTKEHWRPASIAVTVMDANNHKTETQKQAKAGFFSDVDVARCYKPTESDKSIIANWHGSLEKKVDSSVISESKQLDPDIDHESFIATIFSRMEENDTTDTTGHPLNKTQRNIVKELLSHEWLLLAHLCHDWKTYHDVLSAITANKVNEASLSAEILTQARVVRGYFNESAINQFGGIGKYERDAHGQRHFVPGRFYAGRDSTDQLIETDTHVTLADVYRYMTALLTMAIETIEREQAVSPMHETYSPPLACAEHVKVGELRGAKQLIAGDLSERGQQQYWDLIAAIRKENPSAIVGEALNIDERLAAISTEELRLLIETAEAIALRRYDENSEVESIINYIAATLPITLDWRIVLRDQVIPTLYTRYHQKRAQDAFNAVKNTSVEDSIPILSALDINEIKIFFTLPAFLENFETYQKVLSPEVLKNCGWSALTSQIKDMQHAMIIKSRLHKIYNNVASNYREHQQQASWLTQLAPDLNIVEGAFPHLSSYEKGLLIRFFSYNNNHVFYHTQIYSAATLGRLLCLYPEDSSQIIDILSKRTWFATEIFNNFADLLLPLNNKTRIGILSNDHIHSNLPGFTHTQQLLKKAFPCNVVSIVQLIRERYSPHSSVSNPLAIGKLLRLFEPTVIIDIFQQLAPDITTNTIIHCAAIMAPLDAKQRQALIKAMLENEYTRDAAQHVQAMLAFSSSTADDDEQAILSWLKPMVTEITAFSTVSYSTEMHGHLYITMHPFWMALTLIPPEKRNYVYDHISGEEWMKILSTASNSANDHFFNELTNPQLKNLLNKIEDIQWVANTAPKDNGFSRVNGMFIDRLADLLLQKANAYQDVLSKKYQSFIQQTVPETIIALMTDYANPGNFLSNAFIHERSSYDKDVAKKLLIWLDKPEQKNNIGLLKRQITTLLNKLDEYYFHRTFNASTFLNKETSLQRRLIYSLQIVEKTLTSENIQIEKPISKFF